MGVLNSKGRTILLVEDHLDLAETVGAYLEASGYVVDYAADGLTAMHLAVTGNFDAIVLDVVLPGVDGLQVCRRLREDANLPTPIIMLTARDELDDKLKGFDVGADDYLIKPFAFDELQARIRALLRRSQPPEHQGLRFADLTLDPATRDVHRAARRLDLTAKEYDLLEFLVRHPRQVFSKEAIYQHVWGSAFLGESNVIEVHIMRLRDKLEAHGEPRLLHTKRGVGYSLREEQP
jgi:two-component system, OmpR family, response regulator MprA